MSLDYKGGIICPDCGNTQLWSGDFEKVYCRKCSFVYLCWYKK